MGISGNSYDIFLKALIVGSSGVGKSSLFKREIDGSYSESFVSTIGQDFNLKTYTDIDDAPGKRVQVQVWDSMGKEFRERPPLSHTHYRGTFLVYLVYDVTDMESFKAAENWLRRESSSFFSREKGNIVLIGNKADLVAKKQVDTSQGEGLAREFNIPFFEASAKSSRNVHAAFKRGLGEVYKRLYPPVAVAVSQPPPLENAPGALGKIGSLLWSVITAPFRGLWWLLTWPIEKIGEWCCNPTNAEAESVASRPLQQGEALSTESKEQLPAASQAGLLSRNSQDLLRQLEEAKRQAAEAERKAEEAKRQMTQAEQKEREAKKREEKTRGEAEAVQRQLAEQKKREREAKEKINRDWEAQVKEKYNSEEARKKRAIRAKAVQLIEQELGSKGIEVPEHLACKQTCNFMLDPIRITGAPSNAYDLSTVENYYYQKKEFFQNGTDYKGGGVYPDKDMITGVSIPRELIVFKIDVNIKDEVEKFLLEKTGKTSDAWMKLAQLELEREAKLSATTQSASRRPN